MRYKRYDITDTPNDFGYYEAVNLFDCDAYVLTDKSIEGLKSQIDEMELDKLYEAAHDLLEALQILSIILNKAAYDGNGLERARQKAEAAIKKATL